jgi:hypothetical protein
MSTTTTTAEVRAELEELEAERAAVLAEQEARAAEAPIAVLERQIADKQRELHDTEVAEVERDRERRHDQALAVREDLVRETRSIADDVVALAERWPGFVEAVHNFDVARRQAIAGRPPGATLPEDLESPFPRGIPVSIAALVDLVSSWHSHDERLAAGVHGSEELRALFGEPASLRLAGLHVPNIGAPFYGWTHNEERFS